MKNLRGATKNVNVQDHIVNRIVDAMVVIMLAAAIGVMLAVQI